MRDFPEIKFHFQFGEVDSLKPTGFDVKVEPKCSITVDNILRLCNIMVNSFIRERD